MGRQQVGGVAFRVTLRRVAAVGPARGTIVGRTTTIVMGGGGRRMMIHTHGRLTGRNRNGYTCSRPRPPTVTTGWPRSRRSVGRSGPSLQSIESAAFPGCRQTPRGARNSGVRHRWDTATAPRNPARDRPRRRHERASTHLPYRRIREDTHSGKPQLGWINGSMDRSNSVVPSRHSQARRIDRLFRVDESVAF